MDPTPGRWQVLDERTGTMIYNYRFAGAATSNAFATRMADGRMVVLSPPTGDDHAMFDDLARFGDVGALVVPNGFHHLGQAAWRARFPDAVAYAAPEAATRVAKKNPAAGTFTPLAALQPLLPDHVRVREVPETKCGETWVWVRTEGGNVWFTSDVLANMSALPGPLPMRLLFKWTGSAPGYSVFGLALKFIVKDRRRTLRLLAEDVEAAPPSIMVPAHGLILDDATVAERTRALLEKG